MNRSPSDEVLLNNSLQHFRSGGVIPHPFRVHHRDRSILANAQAVRLRPVDNVLSLDQPEFGEAAFEIRPRRFNNLGRSALRRGLVGTKKDVPIDAADPEAGGLLLKG